MPKKPNYNFEKRQREMAKQKKAEEKAQRKAQKATEGDGEESQQDEAETTTGE